MADKKTVLEKINAWFETNKVSAKAVEVPVPNKERLEKLVAFSLDKTTKSIEKFEDMPLSDGTTIMTFEPAMEVGAMAVITTKDGTIPAPIGEYELQDKRIVVVLEEGVVAEIKEAVVDGEEPIEEPLAEQKQVNDKVKRLIERVEKEQIFEKVAELTNKNEAFAKEVTEKDAKILALETRLESFEKFMKETLTSLLEEPSKAPVVKVTTPFAKEKNHNIFKPKF